MLYIITLSYTLVDNLTLGKSNCAGTRNKGLKYFLIFNLTFNIIHHAPDVESSQYRTCTFFCGRNIQRDLKKVHAFSAIIHALKTRLKKSPLEKMHFIKSE